MGAACMGGQKLGKEGAEVYDVCPAQSPANGLAEQKVQLLLVLLLIQ